jgi:hypothetical protein
MTECARGGVWCIFFHPRDAIPAAIIKKKGAAVSKFDDVLMFKFVKENEHIDEPEKLLRYSQEKSQKYAIPVSNWLIAKKENYSKAFNFLRKLAAAGKDETDGHHHPASTREEAWENVCRDGARPIRIFATGVRPVVAQTRCMWTVFL